MNPGLAIHNNPYFQRTLSERNFALLEGLEAFAAERGHEAGELAIAWLLARSMVSTVMAGVTRSEQVEYNVAAGSWQLTAEDLKRLDEIGA